MTRHDQRILYSALGFLAVVLHEGEANAEHGAADLSGRAKFIAGLIEIFCRDNVPPVGVLIDLDSDASIEITDQIIARHVKELREKHETVLPQEREGLLKLYDRLRHRSSRRQQCEIYTDASADRLADLVLRYLDEEIAVQEKLS